jgi:hypothetical protein
VASPSREEKSKEAVEGIGREGGPLKAGVGLWKLPGLMREESTWNEKGRGGGVEAGRGHNV